MNFIIFVIFSSRKLVNSRNNFCITQLLKIPSSILDLFTRYTITYSLYIAPLRKNIILLNKKTMQCNVFVHNGSQYKIQNERYL